ncbi:acyl--CoA ligase [Frankia sp. AgB1.9]|uniref:class I adenylate-forming enzyme family protein n=1 Tax=unclassified Frankia TaxID=2632575 RepID=UPI0019325A02|nr:MULTISPECIES: class I adenylate-forming enzyme family protein [unclassified Frankia]MBL7487731.1 acyl--CoA ligase [Frankia sp. AgW1.1]MBL7548026.1 acyl--CoA ligase [Frankia sp. AgB1.9]MBL7624102.1 acyl--CoA ligase [Frankia sp. AgB1.8]
MVSSDSESPAGAEPLTIGALLRRAVRENGTGEYVVTPTDRLTYAEADERSARAARWLLAAGVGKGSRVGLFFTNDTDWVTWWLATSRIGALAVPLSTLYTPAEIAKVLRLADVGLLVAPPRVLRIDVEERLEAALPGLADQAAGRLRLPTAPYLRSLVLTGDTDRGWATRWDPAGDSVADDVVPADVLAAVENEVTPADLAIMIHTSGTTADPKGVLHTHGTIVRQTATWPTAVRSLTGVQAAPRVLCAMPFFWIGGVLAAMGALHAPATLLVLPRLEAGAALDLAERERANGIVGWPAFTQQLREHSTFPDRDLSSGPMIAGGPLDLAMSNVPDGFPTHRSLSESGGSFAATDIAIVDEAGGPVAAGAVGELLIRGVGVMAGYNKRERADVFDADGWYHTGDQVYRREDDPRLFYVGRATDLIKAAGANVSPLEVAAVVEEFPDVAQCVVLGVTHPVRGEEVCAIVVPAAESVDVASLTARSRAQLSSYKVPTRWIVATSAQIPTLPSGKLDRRRLSAQIADGTLK